MNKKPLLILVVTFTMAAFATVIAAGLLMGHVLLKVFENPVIASLSKYDSCERYYSDGFQDYTNYCKYDYKEQKHVIENLENNQYFKSVTEKDIEELKSYFDNFENWLEYVDYKDKYDFQKNSIDTTDYFYIENKDTCEKYAQYPDKYSAYNVYFFDVQTKTLFFIHSNI